VRWHAGEADRTLGEATTTSLFRRIVDWLREGYPEGVPGRDRVPLLALLRNTPLTEDEIKEVVREITDAASKAPHPTIEHDEIAAFIEEHTHHDAGEKNIKRVAAKLAAAGWPLAGMGALE